MFVKSIHCKADADTPLPTAMKPPGSVWEDMRRPDAKLRVWLSEDVYAAIRLLAHEYENSESLIALTALCNHAYGRLHVSRLVRHGLLGDARRYQAHTHGF